MNKLKLWGIGVASTVGTLGMGLFAHAAVDADVSSTAASLATTIVDNIKDVLMTNAPTLAILAVLVMAIFLVFKIARRFLGR